MINMYTATLKDLRETGAAWTVTIAFSDGEKAFLRDFTFQSVSDDIIQQAARETIAGLNATKASVGKVTISIGDVIDVAVPKAAQPVADAALDQFLSDYYALSQLLRGVAAKIISADDPALLKLIEKVKAEYIPEYAGKL